MPEVLAQARPERGEVGESIRYGAFWGFLVVDYRGMAVARSASLNADVGAGGSAGVCAGGFGRPELVGSAAFSLTSP